MPHLCLFIPKDSSFVSFFPLHYTIESIAVMDFITLYYFILKNKIKQNKPGVCL